MVVNVVNIVNDLVLFVPLSDAFSIDFPRGRATGMLK